MWNATDDAQLAALLATELASGTPAAHTSASPRYAEVQLGDESHYWQQRAELHAANGTRDAALIRDAMHAQS